MPEQENQNTPQGQNQQKEPQNMQDDQPRQTPGYNENELRDRQTGTSDSAVNQQDTGWRPTDDSAVETPPAGGQTEGEPARGQTDDGQTEDDKARSQTGGY